MECIRSAGRPRALTVAATTPARCLAAAAPRRTIKPMAVAAPLGDRKPDDANGTGPHRVLEVQATLDDINRALAACIKEAALMSSLEKINRGIGKEISKAAQKRFS